MHTPTKYSAAFIIMTSTCTALVHHYPFSNFLSCLALICSNPQWAYYCQGKVLRAVRRCWILKRVAVHFWLLLQLPSYSDSFFPTILKSYDLWLYNKKGWKHLGSGAALVLVGRLLCPTLLMDSWGTSLSGELLFCLYQIPSADVIPGDDSEGGKKYFATWFEDFFNSILGHLHFTTNWK